MPTKGPPGKQDQLHYIVVWFEEYSEMQRDDFMEKLIKKYSVAENNLPDLVNGMHVSERPPSIFQCRMKLFDEWFDTWSDEDKTELLERLEKLDESFIEKFHKSVGMNGAEVALNGTTNGATETISETNGVTEEEEVEDEDDNEDEQ